MRFSRPGDELIKSGRAGRKKRKAVWEPGDVERSPKAFIKCLIVAMNCYWWDYLAEEWRARRIFDGRTGWGLTGCYQGQVHTGTGRTISGDQRRRWWAPGGGEGGGGGGGGGGQPEDSSRTGYTTVTGLLTPSAPHSQHCLQHSQGNYWTM